MEVTLFWTDFAKNELNKIFHYHNEKANLNIAKKLIKDIIQKTEILKTQPGCGAIEIILENRFENYRFLVHKNYKIIYWL